jgi:hypothetical protein
MKMNENIVVLRRDTKNILRKFSKMKKRISSLKRRIITNESQLKRSFFFFLFHSFFDHLQNRKTAASALQDRQPRQPIISSCQP